MKRTSGDRRREARKRTKDAITERHLWKLSLLRAFIAKHGWDKLGKQTIVPPGVRLYTWIRARRVDYQSGQIADWLVTECEGIPGWSWSPVQDAYRRNLDNLRAGVRKHGWDWLRTKPVVDDIQLERWVAHRRSEHNRGTIERWLIRALEAIPGWTWDPRTESQTRNLRELRGYVFRHGWDAVNEHTVSRTGLHIGQWMNNIRAVHRKRTVPPWLVAGLESIAGWTWEPRRARQNTKLTRLATFVAKHGWDRVTEELVVRGDAIGTWVSYCRARYREGILPADTVTGLEAIPGWSWSARKSWPRATDSSGRFVGRRRRA